MQWVGRGGEQKFCLIQTGGERQRKFSYMVKEAEKVS